jgi:hypothetical protein
MWEVYLKQGEANMGSSLRQKLDLVEHPKFERSFKCSWDNHCNGNDRIMTRLDRIYASKDLLPNQTSGPWLYFIKKDDVRLDHDLVSYILYYIC